jgi:hypothetical protein
LRIGWSTEQDKTIPPDPDLLTLDPRLLLLQPLIEPITHCLIPEFRILRFQDPVPFIREVEHFRRDASPLQCREELQSLLSGDHF